MNKVIAMYFLQTTSSTPALVGLFTDADKASAFLKGKDQRKYYMRDYYLNSLLS